MELLEWDSAFFGRRIATLAGQPLDADTLVRALASCRTQAVDCLYLLADADDLAGLRLAEAYAFQLMDVRMTLATAVGVGPGTLVRDDRIRPADSADVPALRALAEVSHTATRFFADERFDRAACRALYATWIERSCAGWADAVFVAAAPGQPVGYVTCHRRAGRRGEIGLFAVAEAARGQGLGQALVERALDWCRAEGLAEATVVTQGRSVAAQRLYQRCGFRTATVQLWYHYWF